MSNDKDNEQLPAPNLIGAPGHTEGPAVVEDPDDGYQRYFDGDDLLDVQERGPVGFDVPDSYSDEDERREKIPAWAKVSLTMVLFVAVIAVAAFTGVVFFSDNSGNTTARDREVVETTDGLGEGSGTPPPPDDPEVNDTTPADPMFSWWGDRLSVNSLRYSPSIGITDHPYFWHADESDPPASEVINTIERVRLAEENGEPDEDLGTLGGTVVFSFGNTEDIDGATLSALRSAVGPGRTLVLVGVGALNNSIQPWRVALNQRYEEFAESNSNTRFVDWQEQVDANPDYVDDDSNLTQAGTSAWANLVNQEIKDIYYG